VLLGLQFKQTPSKPFCMVGFRLLPEKKITRRSVANAVRQYLHRIKGRPNKDAAMIRVYDEAGNVIETHEHKGDFTGP